MHNPGDALQLVRRWDTTEAIGDSSSPMMVVDLRNVDRGFRVGDQDHELKERLEAAPWVNVAVVDPDLNPAMSHLADAFDVIIGDNTDSDTAVDTDDVDGTLATLETAISGSPRASVALAQLLRLTHATSIGPALHAESLTYGLLQTSSRFHQWLGTRQRVPAPRDELVVQIDRVGSTLHITLDRADRRNALNVAMRDQLCEALHIVDLDHTLDGAVLRGNGSNFSAGGDLDEFGSTPSATVGHHVRMVRSLPALMARLADRVRVHVHGSCVGAGIELPAFVNSVIAHPDATFRLPEVGFGLVPGAGGTVSVTRRCGRHRTAWLALTGSPIGARQALRWQLIDRIDASVFEA